MALLFNSLSPILQFSSHSPSLNLATGNCFGKSKLMEFRTRSFPEQHSRTHSVSTTTLRDQEYQFHLNDLVLQVDSLDAYEEKKQKIREFVEWREEEDPMEKLIFVDTIQRLGMAHHFEKEIGTIMKKLHLKMKSENATFIGSHSLRRIALSFRLLRQRGYQVSPDVFNDFKGRNGKFRGELKQDIWGLLELYEATQLSFEGEIILDEAQDFSRQILCQELAKDMNFTDSNILQMRMSHPFHKSLTIITGKNIPSEAGGMNRWITALTELSEFDFFRGLHTYKYECLQVSRWWNDMNLNRELKLARNQPLKWYAWSMAMLKDDMNLSEQRVQLTKSIAFIYLIDDVFDLYGTLDELEIFNEAVHVWEYSAMDMLPDYMKSCYKALLDTTNEIASTICENHGYNPIITLKQTWACLCNAFLMEAKWLASRNLPSAEEYLVNGKVSSGVHVVLVHLFFLLGLQESDLHDTCKIISCVAAILRLWDDLGSAQDEHQNGRDGSYIECYMRDEPSIAVREGRKHVEEIIGREWKRLNKECLNQSSASQFEEAALNLARMVPLMYSYDHNHRLPLLKKYLELMLLNSDLSSSKQEQLV